MTLVSPREIGVLLGYLRTRGVVPEPAVLVATLTRVDVLLTEYRGYLLDERGLVTGDRRPLPGRRWPVPLGVAAGSKA